MNSNPRWKNDRPPDPAGYWVGCCASSRDDEDWDAQSRQSLKEKISWPLNEQYHSEEQLQFEPAPYVRPLASRTESSRSAPSVGRTPGLKAGRTPLFSRSSSAYSARPQRPQTSRSVRKLKIGAPTDFRRVANVDELQPRRRRSFRPLELSIYMPGNRLSALPDFSSEWDKLIDSLQEPSQARLSTRTIGDTNFAVPRKPVRPARPRSTTDSALVQSRASLRFSMGFLLNDINTSAQNSETTTLAPVQSWPQDPRRESAAAPTTLAAPPAPTASTAPTRPVRPARPSMTDSPAAPGAAGAPSAFSGLRDNVLRSPSPALIRPAPDAPNQVQRSGSLRSRRKQAADADVDEAIRELNTIVEERKVGGTQPPERVLSPALKDNHIPKLAPKMNLRVRSETLSDIGSAMTLPYTTNPLMSNPPEPEPAPFSPSNESAIIPASLTNDSAHSSRRYTQDTESTDDSARTPSDGHFDEWLLQFPPPAKGTGASPPRQIINDFDALPPRAAAPPLPMRSPLRTQFPHSSVATADQRPSSRESESTLGTASLAGSSVGTLTESNLMSPVSAVAPSPPPSRQGLNGKKNFDDGRVGFGTKVPMGMKIRINNNSPPLREVYLPEHSYLESPRTPRIGVAF